MRRLRIAADYAAGAPLAGPGPEALLVETTVRCNLRCPMCPRTGGDYGARDMPDEILWPLLEEHAALGGDHVYLYGLGEPLLDRRIFDIIGRARSLGLTTILSTNGTLLDEGLRQRLLDSGLHHLIVSLDAATAATYDRYRPGGDFDRTVARVRALAAEKAARRPAMIMVVQFVRVAGNLHEQERFRQQWEGTPGIDRVRFKDEDIGLPDHALYEADGWRRRNPCHLLWRGPLVARYDGRVHACYNFAGQDVEVGNLHDSSLAEIWASPALQRLRRQHAAGRLDPAS
ncbi:MAG: radical SAM protein, partial [Deltaproteobacteria bacterium]